MSSNCLEPKRCTCTCSGSEGSLGMLIGIDIRPPNKQRLWYPEEEPEPAMCRYCGHHQTKINQDENPYKRKGLGIMEKAKQGRADIAKRLGK